MPKNILRKLLILILIPAAFIAGWLYTSGTGTLAEQIPGTAANGTPNTTCVYFFMHGFKNEVAATNGTCPRTVTLKDVQGAA